MGCVSSSEAAGERKHLDLRSPLSHVDAKKEPRFRNALDDVDFGKPAPAPPIIHHYRHTRSRARLGIDGANIDGFNVPWENRNSNAIAGNRRLRRDDKVDIKVTRPNDQDDLVELMLEMEEREREKDLRIKALERSLQESKITQEKLAFRDRQHLAHQLGEGSNHYADVEGAKCPNGCENNTINGHRTGEFSCKSNSNIEEVESDCAGTVMVAGSIEFKHMSSQLDNDEEFIEENGEHEHEERPKTREEENMFSFEPRQTPDPLKKTANKFRPNNYIKSLRESTHPPSNTEVGLEEEAKMIDLEPLEPLDPMLENIMRANGSKNLATLLESIPEDSAAEQNTSSAKEVAAVNTTHQKLDTGNPWLNDEEVSPKPSAPVPLTATEKESVGVFINTNASNRTGQEISPTQLDLRRAFDRMSCTDTGKLRDRESLKNGDANDIQTNLDRLPVYEVSEKRRFTTPVRKSNHRKIGTGLELAQSDTPETSCTNTPSSQLSYVNTDAAQYQRNLNLQNDVDLVRYTVETLPKIRQEPYSPARPVSRSPAQSTLSIPRQTPYARDVKWTKAYVGYDSSSRASQESPERLNLGGRTIPDLISASLSHPPPSPDQGTCYVHVNSERERNRITSSPNKDRAAAELFPHSRDKAMPSFSSHNKALALRVYPPPPEGSQNQTQVNPSGHIDLQRKRYDNPSEFQKVWNHDVTTDNPHSVMHRTIAEEGLEDILEAKSRAEKEAEEAKARELYLLSKMKECKTLEKIRRVNEKGSQVTQEVLKLDEISAQLVRAAAVARQMIGNKNMLAGNREAKHSSHESQDNETDLEERRTRVPSVLTDSRSQSSFENFEAKKSIIGKCIQNHILNEVHQPEEAFARPKPRLVAGDDEGTEIFGESESYSQTGVEVKDSQEFSPSRSRSSSDADEVFGCESDSEDDENDINVLPRQDPQNDRKISAKPKPPEVPMRRRNRGPLQPIHTPPPLPDRPPQTPKKRCYTPPIPNRISPNKNLESPPLPQRRSQREAGGAGSKDATSPPPLAPRPPRRAKPSAHPIALQSQKVSPSEAETVKKKHQKRSPQFLAIQQQLLESKDVNVHKGWTIAQERRHLAQKREAASLEETVSVASQKPLRLVKIHRPIPNPENKLIRNPKINSKKKKEALQRTMAHRKATQSNGSKRKSKRKAIRKAIGRKGSHIPLSERGHEKCPCSKCSRKRV